MAASVAISKGLALATAPTAAGRNRSSLGTLNCSAARPAQCFRSPFLPPRTASTHFRVAEESIGRSRKPSLGVRCTTERVQAEKEVGSCVFFSLELLIECQQERPVVSHMVLTKFTKFLQRQNSICACNIAKDGFADGCQSREACSKPELLIKAVVAQVVQEVSSSSNGLPAGLTLSSAVCFLEVSWYFPSARSCNFFLLWHTLCTSQNP
jgi:hypothetical protein